MSSVDRRLLLRIIAVGLAAFVVGYLLTAVLFFRGSDRPAVVAVPELRELSADEAEERLETVGLELELGDSLPHPQIRRGEVLAQSPLPGGEVAPGTAVRVILSSGRPQRMVPDVGALTREPATRLLAASGFQVMVEEVPSVLPRDRVVSLDPVPGTRVRLPAAVRLRVSSGPPLVAVPQLFGLKRDAAAARLEAAGLRLGDVGYQFEGPNTEEMVVEQEPLAGDSLRAGGAVRVRIVTSRHSMSDGSGQERRGLAGTQGRAEDGGA